MTDEWLDDFLSLEPVPQPRLVKEPFGHSLAYEALVDMSGLQNVVSMPRFPEVWLHEEDEFDYLSPRHGNPAYSLSLLKNPSDDDTLMARELLRRLAYGFHDYAAREIVARFHRDVRRAHAAAADDCEDPDEPAPTVAP
jgi:hypothetical protein